MTTLLNVENLQKTFGDFEAIADVSFDLRPGQLLALIGPNGAGKSTTFNCVNGQLKATSGKMLFSPDAPSTAERIAAEKDGEALPEGQQLSLTGLPPHKIWRLGVGRTFQITATFLSMSVRENVQMVLMNKASKLSNLWRRAARQFTDEAQELLELVGLEDQAETACSVLAYGDLKRLELAMALANNPKLLLMDEPTAGMGVAERQGLMALTHKIAKERDIGVLFTEHDMDVVFGFADWIIVMHRGKIIAKGQSDDIRHNKKVKEVYLGKEV